MIRSKTIEIPDFNDYDFHRIMRDNVKKLKNKNTQILSFIQGDNSLPGDVRYNFALQVSNNAAEMMYLIMSPDKAADLETYTQQSPLFREGGVS